MATDKNTLPPPRAESEGQLACVSCGAVKGEGKCSNGCVFPEPSKGEQGVATILERIKQIIRDETPIIGEHTSPFEATKTLRRKIIWRIEDEEHTWTTTRIAAGVTQQSVESVYDEAIRTVEGLVCPSQFDGNWRNGYSHAQNDAFRALESAKAKSLAAQNKDQEKS